MAECLCVEDVLYISHTWRLRHTLRVTDAVTVSEAWRSRRRMQVSDAVTITDAWSGHAVRTVADTVTVSEQWRPLAHPKVRAADTVTIGERWSPLRTQHVTDTVTVGEQWRQRRRLRDADTVTVSETWTGLGAPTVRDADAVTITQSWRGRRRMADADAVTVSDAWRTRRRLRTADAVTITQAWLGLRHPHGRDADAVTTTDAWTMKRHPRMRVADEVWVDEAWRLPHVEGLATTAAWTANTDTWAMSRYSSAWAITDLATIDGALFGASPDGLQRMAGDTFGGTAIDAAFTTGLDALGNDATKHMRMVYAGAQVSRIDGLQVTVHDVTAGVKAQHTYPFEERRGEDIAPQRAKVGRGMKSTRWQFTIGNRNGADFTMESVSVLADMGSRRVS